MKFRNFVFVGFLMLCGIGDVGWSFGQDEECGTDDMMELLFSEYPESLTDFENSNNDWAYYNLTKLGHDENNTIIIPVVVHILHDDGEEDNDGDISDDKVRAVIDRLNNNFRAILGTFGENGNDTYIEFRIANLDKDGDCIEGITHNNIPIRFGYPSDSDSDLTMKNQVRWDPFKYMNIYVTDCMAKIPDGTPIDQVNCDFFNPLNMNSDGTTGYVVTLPHNQGEGSHQAKIDGIVIWDSFFLEGTTLTHEVGHYMNLLHTFIDVDDCSKIQEFNCIEEPNMPPCCRQYGDRCCDTKLCTKISYGEHQCDSNPLTACLGLPYPLENYMSYGKCRTEFTHQQIDRMHFALNESSSRTPLWTSQNHIATGIVVASATESTICDGEPTTLSVTAKSNDQVEWSVLDGDDTEINNSNSLSINVSPNQTTTYLVTVDNECFFDFDEITIIVNPSPILAQTQFNICDTEAINIDLDQDLIDAGLKDFDYIYNWTIDGETVEGGQQTIQGSGMYEVNIIANYVNYDNTITQCINTQMVEILPVNGFSATLDISPSGSTFCQMVMVTANPSPSGDYTYQWSNNRTGPSVGFGNLAEGGQQTISVTITDINTQCTEVLSETLNFQTNVPQPTIQRSASSTECGVDLLVTNLFNYSELKWYLNGEPIFDESQGEFVTGSSYTAKEEGTYYVIGVGDGVGCENQSEDVVLTYNDLEPQPASPSDAEFTLNPIGKTTWGSGIGASPIPHNAVQGYIEVQDGQKLVIQGSNTALYFYDGTSGIKVHKGGVLVVDAATLSASECGTEWDGIIVYGDGLKAHPNYQGGTLNPFIGSPDHGLVALVNGATIQNARTAVYSLEDYDSTDPYEQPLNIGGGIIYADDAKFTNNNTGLKIGRFLAEGTDPQQSVIKNCHFMHDRLWEDMGFYAQDDPTIQAAHKGYEQVLIHTAGEGLKITNNTFESKVPSSIRSEHGTGLRIISTPITIGEPSSDFSNTFKKLYKGIDVYSFINMEETTDIVNNQFEKVDKAITLNTVPFSTIIANAFNVRRGKSINRETYGILTHQSFGFEISNNCFVTGGDIPIPQLNYTKGIVLKDCNFNDIGGSNMSSVNGNTFDGLFKAATQIEGNSTTVQLRCNDYDQTSPALRDWQLPKKSADLQADTEIDPQGNCPNQNAENVVFSSRWHTPSNGIYHIYNETSKIFIFEHDIGSAATQIFGQSPQNNLCTNQFGEEIDANCVNNQPTNLCNAPPSPLLANGGSNYYPYPTNPYPNNTCTVYGEHIRYLLTNRQTQSVIDILNCRNNRGSNKLLAATYAIRGDETATIGVLNNIPDNNYTDYEFKTLIRAVLNNRVNDIERIAGYQYSENAAYAQSLLATLEGRQYDRVSAKVMESQSHSKRATNDFFSSEQELFTLFPNPTNGVFNIQIPNELLKDDSLPLHIYDMKGQLVKTIVMQAPITSVDLKGLKNGIYYCRVEGFDKTEKLVLIK